MSQDLPLSLALNSGRGNDPTRQSPRNILDLLDQAKQNEARKNLIVKEEKKLEKPRGHMFYFKEFPTKLMIYDENSCCCFHKNSAYRRKVVFMSCHPYFDNIIIFAIFLNSVLLAVYDYGDRSNHTYKNKFIETTGVLFSIIFTCEAYIKIVAMGFVCHHNAYLRDVWNWLDFFVVMISIIEYIPFIPSANLKALRVMRVLRPLKSINAFPGIRRLIGTLLSSLRSLFDSFVFMTFIFILLGILGVRLFKGVLYQRCRTTPEPIMDPVTKNYTHWPMAENINRICTLDGSGNFQCPSGTYCGQIIDYPSIPFETEDVPN